MTDGAELYPDIAAGGGLGAVLQAAAVAQGLSFPLTASGADPLMSIAVPSAVAHRKDLVVSAWPRDRRWSIRGCEAAQNLFLVQGETADLAELARAAQAWHDGTGLTDIPGVAPFVTLTGRFEVPDHDPAQLAESEWQYLRTEAAALDWPEYRALVEAAYAAPALRRLYPFTSHWTLRFATTTRPHLAVVDLTLDARRDNRYEVCERWGDLVAEVVGATEAVAEAVRHLPDDLGPVTSGAHPS